MCVAKLAKLNIVSNTKEVVKTEIFFKIKTARYVITYNTGLKNSVIDFYY